MSARCDVCGRKPQYGHKVSHSNRKTNRRFMLNLQRRRLEIRGKMQNVNVCTRCLRTMVKVDTKVAKAAAKAASATAQAPRPATTTPTPATAATVPATATSAPETPATPATTVETAEPAPEA